VAGERDIRAGGAFVEIGIRDRIGRGLARVQAQLRSLGGFVSNLSRRFALLGAGLATGLAAAAHHFAEVGSKIFDMSKRTGASAELLSELGFALEQSGGSAEDLEKALRQSTLLLADAAAGNKTARKTFQDLGLSVEELLGLSADERFTRIADAVGRLGDEVQRTDALAALFGARSGTKLAEVLAGGLGPARAEGAKAGATLTAEQAAQADALGDAFGGARKAVSALVLAIGAGLAPVLTDLAGLVRDNLAAFAGWVRENKAVVLLALAAVPALFGLALALKAVGVAFALTSALIGLATVAVGLLTTAVGVLSAPLLALAGVLVAVGLAGTDLGGIFGGVGEAFRVAWGGIQDALAAGDLQGALRIAGKGLELIWVRVTDKLAQVWSDFLQTIGKALSDFAAGVQDVFRVALLGAAWPAEIGVSGLLAGAGAGAVPAPARGKSPREKALEDELAALAGAAGDAAAAVRLQAEAVGVVGAIGKAVEVAAGRFQLARLATADQQARGGFTQQAQAAFAFGGTLKASLDVEKDQLRVLEQIRDKPGAEFG
jgi:hypothetical protein